MWLVVFNVLFTITRTFEKIRFYMLKFEFNATLLKETILNNVPERQIQF